jgi:FKBP-type peptidyl-prolyl cis-trans isomerase
VRLVITELGSGLFPPNPSNNLKVAYTGRLFSDGTVFDSNDAFFLKISDNVINGWKIGLSLMTQGSHAKLYIPSLYAYGASGQGSSIPGNSILVFDIYLESVTPTVEQNNRLALDIDAIDFELEENSIVAVEHPTGIRYVVTQVGDGSAPDLYSQVKINYLGKLFLMERFFRIKLRLLLVHRLVAELPIMFQDW